MEEFIIDCLEKITRDVLNVNMWPHVEDALGRESDVPFEFECLFIFDKYLYHYLSNANHTKPVLTNMVIMKKVLFFSCFFSYVFLLMFFFSLFEQIANMELCVNAIYITDVQKASMLTYVHPMIVHQFLPRDVDDIFWKELSEEEKQEMWDDMPECFIASGTLPVASLCEAMIERRLQGRLGETDDDDCIEDDWEEPLKKNWAALDDRQKKKCGWKRWEETTHKERMKCRAYVGWCKLKYKEVAKVLRLPFFMAGYSGWFYSPVATDTLHMRVALVRYNGRLVFVLAQVLDVNFKAVCVLHFDFNMLIHYDSSL